MARQGWFRGFMAPPLFFTMTGRGMPAYAALRTDGEVNCSRIGEVAARGGERDGVGARGRPGRVRRKDPGAAARQSEQASKRQAHERPPRSVAPPCDGRRRQRQGGRGKAFACRPRESGDPLIPASAGMTAMAGRRHYSPEQRHEPQQQGPTAIGPRHPAKRRHFQRPAPPRIVRFGARRDQRWRGRGERHRGR